MNPAAAFERHARQTLPTASAVARLVNVSPSQWHAWTSGQKSPSYRTMVGWLVRWEEVGGSPVSLVITSKEAEVREVRRG